MQLYRYVFLFLLVFVIVSCNDDSPVGDTPQDIYTIYGSGNFVSIIYPVGEFDKIAVRDGIILSVNYADTCSVRVFADDNVHQYIEYSIIHDTLIVGMKKNHKYINAKREVNITLPSLGYLRAEGGSRVGLTMGLTGTEPLFSGSEPFTCIAKDKSSILGYFISGKWSLDVSGYSNIYLSGETPSLVADISEHSELTLFNVFVPQCLISVDGQSTVGVRIEGVLDAEVSGGSRLFYWLPTVVGNIVVNDSSTSELLP